MNKTLSGRMRLGRKGKKGDTAKLAAQLAPLEELDTTGAAKQVGSGLPKGNPEADPRYGAIVVDNENLNLPKDMMEGQSDKTFLGIEPVVLVILFVMLTFISFIAWQISLMPAQ